LKNEEKMKDSIKFDKIMNHFNIKGVTLANILGVTPATISQWRNPQYKRFNNMHKFALKEALGIPLEVFSDEINSEDDIIRLVKDSQSRLRNNICDISYRVYDKIIGEFNCYFYNSCNNFKVNKLEIKDNLDVIYETDKAKYYGRLISLDKYQGVIKLRGELECLSNYLIFSVPIKMDRIFYGIITSSDNYLDILDSVNMMILTRSDNRVEESFIKKIFKNPYKKKINFLDFINDIRFFNRNREKKELLGNNHIDSVRGDWYVYFKDSIFKEHKFVIKENYTVLWYKNGVLYGRGVVYFNRGEVMLRVENIDNIRKSYFIFENKRAIDIQALIFKSSLYITNEDIIGVGIISRNRIEESVLKEIFKFEHEFYFYINKFKTHLEEVKRVFKDKKDK
jgi:hypothetical protein